VAEWETDQRNRHCFQHLSIAPEYPQCESRAMQTESQRSLFPVQDFPAHLLDVAHDPSSSTHRENPAVSQSRPEVLPDSVGALRGAAFCLPIAVVMWAIIIAAVLHFLIA
jgi:hypothetical protein